MRPDLGHCVMLRDRDVRLIVGAVGTSPAAPGIAPQ